MLIFPIDLILVHGSSKEIILMLIRLSCHRTQLKMIHIYGTNNNNNNYNFKRDKESLELCVAWLWHIVVPEIWKINKRQYGKIYEYIYGEQNLFGISSRRKIPKLRYERAPLTAATQRKKKSFKTQKNIKKIKFQRAKFFVLCCCVIFCC